MKKLFPLLAVVCAIFAVSSCKNDLKILAPYKDIPVVYGLLDQNDSAHYIRVNKAYEGAGDAYTMASNYDSVNYPLGTITVQLQDLNNGNIISTYMLTPDSSIPVDPGTFPFPHQVLYKTKAKLNVNDQYNLIVTNEKSGKVITGSTSLLTDVAFTSTWITFNKYFTPSWNIGSPTSVSWNSSSARIYQMTIRFYYDEITNSTGSTALKYIDWVFATQTTSTLTGGNSMQYNYSGYDFLHILNGNISPGGLIYKRRADSVHIIFTTGSDDFNTYIQLSQPSLGINQEKPFFSNIKNAVGIFTSRHTQTFTKSFNYPVVDSIVRNSLTAPLNFEH